MYRGKARRLVSKQNTRKIWFIACLTLIFLGGCGDPDHNRFPGLTPPTVISIVPPEGALGVCPNTVITGTFSEAMNVATINSSTFTVAPGAIGTVTHDAS